MIHCLTTFFPSFEETYYNSLAEFQEPLSCLRCNSGFNTLLVGVPIAAGWKKFRNFLAWSSNFIRRQCFKLQRFLSYFFKNIIPIEQSRFFLSKQLRHLSLWDSETRSQKSTLFKNMRFQSFTHCSQCLPMLNKKTKSNLVDEFF